MTAVPDQVREAFQGKRGKILLAVGAGLTAWLWWSRRQAAAAVPQDETVDGTAVGTGGASGGGGGTVPSTTDPSGTGTGAKPGRPTTNAAWIASGMDFLVSLGTPAATAHTALTLAIEGQPVTIAQQALVSLVLAALGSPPEGMPPMTTTPSPGGGGGNPPKDPPKTDPPKTPAPTPARTYTVKSGDTLWSIAVKFYGDGSQYGRIYKANSSKIETAAKSHGKASSENGKWIYTGTVLTIP